MKKILVLIFASFFLSQANNLEAMKKKLSFICDVYAQLRNNVDQEAQEAIHNIKEWLTFELIEDILMVKIGDKERRFSESSDIPPDEMNDDDISDPFLDLKRIDLLSIGQRIVLTCWQKYPYHAAQVMQTLHALKPKDSSTLSELVCIDLFKRLIIAYNFGSDVASLIQKYEQDNYEEFCLRVFEKSEQISYLFKNAVRENLTVKELYQGFDPDLLRLLFMVRYPYFFEKFIVTSYSNEQDNIVKLFLEHGFNPNYRFIYNSSKNILYGTTLLHAAVVGKRAEMVLLLLTWGADPECEDSCDISPWKISCDQMRCRYSCRAHKINALLERCLSEETKKALKASDK